MHASTALNHLFMESNLHMNSPFPGTLRILSYYTLPRIAMFFNHFLPVCVKKSAEIARFNKSLFTNVT